MGTLCVRTRCFRALELIVSPVVCVDLMESLWKRLLVSTLVIKLCLFAPKRRMPHTLSRLCVVPSSSSPEDRRSCARTSGDSPSGIRKCTHVDAVRDGLPRTEFPASTSTSAAPSLQTTASPSPLTSLCPARRCKLPYSDFILQ